MIKTKPKLKILQLIASLYRGGAETLVLNLAEALSSDTNDVHLCAFGSANKVGGNSLYPLLKDLNCTTHFIPTKRLYALATIRKLKDYIQKEKFDVIHTHLSDSNIIGNFIGRMLNIPVVTTFHNLPYQYEILQKSRSIPMRRFVSNKASHLVAISDSIRTEFIEDWKISSDRISTVHNAIDIDQYLALPIGTPATPNEPLIVTSIGRLEAQKAHQYLLEAAKIVLQEFPSTRFQLVGDGLLKGDLEQLAVQLGIQKNVDFLGIRDDIPNILSETDIFVLPSLWEGLPISVLEAMAAGRPQVLTDVGGNRELIQNEEHGFLVEPKDVEGLASALKKLCRDVSLREEMGNSARLRVIEEFNVGIAAKKYLEIYRAVV